MRSFTFLAIAVGLAASALPAQPPPIPAGTTAGASGNTVVVFLPQQFFSNEELDPVQGQLSHAGIAVKIATSETAAAAGMNRVLVNPDLPLAAVRPEDFAAIVLIGGSGASLYWDDSLLQARCREFAEAGKVVAAIGIAPITLARAGLLKGRAATVFRDRNAIGYLRERGARVGARDLVSDRNVITAANAEQARAFGRAVATAVLRSR
jgi:protease I